MAPRAHRRRRKNLTNVFRLRLEAITPSTEVIECYRGPKEQRVPDFSSPKETIRDPASILVAGSIVPHRWVGKNYPQRSYRREKKRKMKGPGLT
jgi:hypothetical protein